MFNTLLLEPHDGETTAEIRQLDTAQLPEGDLLVKVDYSCLNYKDALAITGKGKIVKQWPMVPGIDLAGTIVRSDSEYYAEGDQVLVTGWGLGEQRWGGLSEYVSLNSDWVIPLPDGMTPQMAMQLGTAGLTAMLCVMALEEGGVEPEDGPIAVTGASGGVGSLSVAILAKLGYRVSAITGRAEQNQAQLSALGAAEVIDRAEFAEPGRPLEKQRWSGAIDTVGGVPLANLLAQTEQYGTVAACGLAADFRLPTTVMPFILRGIRLQGVDSVYCPPEVRVEAWQRLLELTPASYFEQFSTEVTLAGSIAAAQDLLDGKIRGRVLVKLA